MLGRLINFIRKAVSNILSKNSITRALDVTSGISKNMSDTIELWCKLYTNEAPWLSDNVKSLNIPSSIASEIARLAMLEFESDITGSKRADYLSEQYKPIKNVLRNHLEYALAKGGLVLKPYISGDKILCEYIHADCFYPTEYDSTGQIISAVFIERKKNDDTSINTRLEYHRMTSEGIYISNTAYRAFNGEELGREIPLSTVTMWAELEPIVLIKNATVPLFSYFKVPSANNIDPYSPLGVSVYAKAVDHIKFADEQFGRLMWEFEGSELAINAGIDMFQGLDEKTKAYHLPKLNKRLYRALDNGNENLFEVFSPAIRDVSLVNGFNQILRRIEFNCGLSYGILSDPSAKELTATEVISSKQRLYSTVSEVQGALQKSLECLIKAMDILSDLLGIPSGVYEVSYSFDDSIITDINTERQLFLQEIRDGIRQKWEYRVKFFGESEEQAKSMIESEGPSLFGV